jgi:hypothetical protein
LQGFEVHRVGGAENGRSPSPNWLDERAPLSNGRTDYRPNCYR